MSVKTNQYSSALVQDTSRGPSQSIWADCPLEDFIQGAGGGIGTFGMLDGDDFLTAGNFAAAVNVKFNFGRYAAFADTNGALQADPNNEGGIVAVGAGSNTGVNINFGSNAGAYRIVSGASGFPLGQKLWFECRVAMGSIAASKRDIFVGLMDTLTTVNTATAGIWSAADTFQTTMNMIGFHARGGATNPGDFGVVYNVASGTVQRPTGLTTLGTTVTGSAPTAYAAVTNGAPTGFLKLGFVFDPTGDKPALLAPSANNGHTQGTLYKPLIQFYVNGQVAPEFLASNNVQASTFPTGWMNFVFGYLSDSGTAPGNAYIDWWRCAQLGSY